MTAHKADIKKSLKQIEFPHSKYRLYKAAFGGYERNFPRDSLRTCILMDDIDMLRDQLLFCAETQGNKKNPQTGEEPGKIVHEYPGVELEGLKWFKTEYNACDTTSEFLDCIGAYFAKTNDKDFLRTVDENIDKAVDYILTHVNDEGAFIEDPKFCDAERYALKATYWKDSVLKGRAEGPAYPIVFSLVQAQTIKALRGIAEATGRDELKGIADNMKDYLVNQMWDDRRGLFYIAIDAKGKIEGVTTDSLHALYYLDRKDLPAEKLESIVKASAPLETKFGYRVMSEGDGAGINDTYHVNTVWPFEQAFIHMGARKHGLGRVEEVSRRVMDFKPMEYSFPEILIFTGDDKVIKGGNDPQLWSIGAHKYFTSLD